MEDTAWLSLIYPHLINLKRGELSVQWRAVFSEVHAASSTFNISGSGVGCCLKISHPKSLWHVGRPICLVRLKSVMKVRNNFGGSAPWNSFELKPRLSEYSGPVKPICAERWPKTPFISFIRMGGGPRVVVSTAAFHARVRGSVPGLGGLKETKLFLPHPRVKVSIVGSLRDREVACSASDRQGSNFESCVWRTVSSQSSHHPQEVLLAQFSLYVHKGGLKPDSFHFFLSEYFCHFTKWQIHFSQQTQHVESMLA